MRLDKFAIAGIVFFVFVIGGVFMVHDIETTYSYAGVDMGLDEYMNETFKTATGEDIDSYDYNSIKSQNDTYSDSESYEDRLLGGDVDDTDTESSMFAGSFSATKLITAPISLTNEVLNQFASKVGIPTVFIQYAFSAVVILVMFSIIFLIFRVKV